MLLLGSLAYSNSSSAIKLTFGTKCHPSGDGACEGDRGICIIIEIKNAEWMTRYLDVSALLGDDMAYADAALTGQNRLRLDVLGQHSDAKLDPSFKVEAPITLSSGLASDLGVKSVVILPGVYPVDYSLQRFGTVMLDVDTH